jgi:tetratricopeptide (TPR) repeat protein
MVRLVAALAGLGIIFSALPVRADIREDCQNRVDLDRAIRGCNQLIANNAKDASGYFNRGQLYFTKKDYDRAIADYSKLIEIEPKNALAYNSRGNAYAWKQDSNRAVADYSKAIELNPTNATFYNNRCSHNRDRIDAAIADCNKAIELNPSYAAAYSNRGQAYEAKKDYDRAIADYSKLIEIDPKSAGAYNRRGIAYASKKDSDRALADYSKAIELNPTNATFYNNRCGHNRDRIDDAIADCNKAIELNSSYAAAYSRRGQAYVAKKDYDQALADNSKAIELDPKSADYYRSRSSIHLEKRDYDRSIADSTKAMEIDPRSAIAYSNRCAAYREAGQIDRAISDCNKAIELDPKNARPYFHRGLAYRLKGEIERAVADLSESSRLDSNPQPLVERAAVFEARGEIERAIVDYRAALELPGRLPRERDALAQARRRLAAIESRTQKDTKSAVIKPATVSRRVALVIANSDYGSVGRLTNPRNDGRAVAASLRRLGFAEVIERYDLGHTAMGTALKEFGDRAADADWAVVYFAGHGIEMNGVAYLIPIDAKLERDSHILDETVPLSRVLDKVESAQKLRLVILDSCRNNPFVSRMVRSGAQRSIGRGLGQIEPEGGVLVAYAAKHGTTAEDGSTDNSPFAEALITYLEEPGLEINFMFRKIRDQVLSKTGRRQEPYLYGSLPSESLFFKQAEAR